VAPPPGATTATSKGEFMADEDKKQPEKQAARQKHAVYTLPSGSLTIGEARLVPFTATPVSPETAKAIDTDTHPVKLFDDEAPAKALATELRLKEEEKNKPKK
jgi:hypothetical protein